MTLRQAQPGRKPLGFGLGLIYIDIQSLSLFLLDSFKSDSILNSNNFNSNLTLVIIDKWISHLQVYICIC